MRGTCGRSGSFLNNRHYDPTTGTFVSVDPLVTKTMQPYIYGAANPVTFSDPSGLEPRPIHCRAGCGDPRKPKSDPHARNSDGYGDDRIGGRPNVSPPGTPIPNVGNYSFSIELTGRTSSLGSIANRVGIDPALLLLIYQKESAGRSFLARWGEAFDVCNCSSSGPTNIQFDVFQFHFANRGGLLDSYRPTGYENSSLSTLWEDLGNEQFADLALAVTALEIDRISGSFSSGRAGVNVTPLEWGLAQYRFGPETVGERVTKGLTPAFVGEFGDLRAGYSSAVSQLCGLDACGHPWFASPSVLGPA